MHWTCKQHRKKRADKYPIFHCLTVKCCFVSWKGNYHQNLHVVFCLCIPSNLLCIWTVLWNTYWPCLTVSSHLTTCICFPGPSPAGCALCGPAGQKAKCLSACSQSQRTFPTPSSFTAWLNLCPQSQQTSPTLSSFTAWLDLCPQSQQTSWTHSSFTAFCLRVSVIFPTCSLYPKQKRACSALHPQAWTDIYNTGPACRHLPSAVPWISEDRLLTPLCVDL